MWQPLSGAAPYLAALLVWTGVRIAGTTALPSFVVASLNVGGDGPQPEYLGGNWESDYGHVESAFGAMIIFLSNPDAEPCRLRAKYVDRYTSAFRTYCKVPYLTKHDSFGKSQMTELGRVVRGVKVTDFVLDKVVTNIRNKNSIKRQINKKIGDHTTLVSFAQYLMSGKSPPPKPGETLTYESLSNLDRDEECKHRKAFPYFSKGFMEWYGMLYKGFDGEPFEAYWKSMMAVKGKTCKYVQKKVTVKKMENGEEIGEETKEEASDEYIPLMVFDLLVVRAFHETLCKGFLQKTTPVEYLIGDKLNHRKQHLVQGLLDKVNILFLQESESALVASKDPEALTSRGLDEKGLAPGLYGDQIAQYAVKVKKEFDAAILLKDFKFVQPSAPTRKKEKPKMVPQVTALKNGSGGGEVKRMVDEGVMTIAQQPEEEEAKVLKVLTEVVDPIAYPVATADGGEVVVVGSGEDRVAVASAGQTVGAPDARAPLQAGNVKMTAPDAQGPLQPGNMQMKWMTKAQGVMQPEADVMQSYDNAYLGQVSRAELQATWKKFCKDLWTKDRWVRDDTELKVTIAASDVDLYPGGAAFNLETKDKDGKLSFKEDIHDVSATAVAVARVGARNILLLSMHPKSSGRPCVLFAYMAKEFFSKMQRDLSLHSMLVGMDANVLTKEDKAGKKNKPDKNGFTWGEFEARVVKMGFGVIYDPKKVTVWKQRTFLQTQLSKAAKVDIAIKDVMLQYPRDSLSLSTVEVVNVQLKSEDAPWWNLYEHARRCLSYTKSLVFKGEYGYYAGSPYPIVNWPLDHFMTVAQHVKVRPKDTVVVKVGDKLVYQYVTTGTKKKRTDAATE